VSNTKLAGHMASVTSSQQYNLFEVLLKGYVVEQSSGTYFQ